jgi:uncharacterized membrane protein YidH (DUF202 family)
MNQQQNEPGSSGQLAEQRLQLNIEGTQLALERTHLSWIRTVITMISAGVAIDKGLQALHLSRLEAGNALFQNGHAAGLILTISGTVLLLLASTNYIIRTRQLDHMRGKRASLFAPGILLSFLILLICILFIYLVSSTQGS